MKKTFLCCAAVISTSMVFKRMKHSAAAKGIEVDVIAVGMDEFDATLPKYDCCLLGPQIKYKLAEFKAKGDAVGKPVGVINAMDYGMMKGEKILNEALAMIG